MLAFRLLVPPNIIEASECIDLGDIIVSMVDLEDLGLELAVVVVVRVLGTVVQAQGLVHVLIVAECIKVLITFYQESISDVDRLDILLEHAHILAYPQGSSSSVALLVQQTQFYAPVYPLQSGT